MGPVGDFLECKTTCRAAGHMFHHMSMPGGGGHKRMREAPKA